MGAWSPPLVKAFFQMGSTFCNVQQMVTSSICMDCQTDKFCWLAEKCFICGIHCQNLIGVSPATPKKSPGKEHKGVCVIESISTAAFQGHLLHQHPYLEDTTPHHCVTRGGPSLPAVSTHVSCGFSSAIETLFPGSPPHSQLVEVPSKDFHVVHLSTKS